MNALERVAKIEQRYPVTLEQYHCDLALAVAAAQVFENALASVKTAMDASESEMRRLREEALRLSRESPLTTVESVRLVVHRRFPDYPFRSKP